MPLSERERDALVRHGERLSAIIDSGRKLTRKEREQFDTILERLEGDNTMRNTNIETRHTMSRDTQARVNARRHLIGTDTDVPEWRPEGERDGVPALEARHSLSAYMAQTPDWNKTGVDFESFDRDSFYRQLLTGNKEGREYRALAEGAQSASLTGAGVLVPIQFSADVLELLRANLVFTSPGADGAINGPAIVPMERQIEYVPNWASDASAATSYIAENAQMTPGTATLGTTQLQAVTMASISLASRQLVEDTNTTGGLASLIETNLAAAVARGMDQGALYGTGHSNGQPPGILTSAYSSQVHSVSLGTNGGSPTNFDEMSKAVEQVRIANDEPTGIYTNPQVAGTYARLFNSTYGHYIEPSTDVEPFWPPGVSTAFSATETQGTSNAASSALVLNANRVILGMRVALGFQTLTERYADFNQYGFLAYVRFDWEFPYASATARVQGVLTT